MIRSFKLPENMRLANLIGLAETLPAGIAQAYPCPRRILCITAAHPVALVNATCVSVHRRVRSPLLFQVVVQASRACCAWNWQLSHPVCLRSCIAWFASKQKNWGAGVCQSSGR